MRVQVIDLFCGVGGFTEGALNAGAEVVLAIDNDIVKVKQHKLNHPNGRCIALHLGGCLNDMKKLLSFYIIRRKGVHFHLHMSPPCQAISNASWSVEKGEGYDMINWCLDLVDIVKPDSWSLENVLPLQKFLTRHSIPFEKVNALDYGVPQSRRRVFAGEGWKLSPTHIGNHQTVAGSLPDLKGEFIASPSMEKRWKNLSIERYIPTITSQSISQIRIGYLGEKRTLKIKELVTLQGYPDLVFDSKCSTREIREMIGNLVCPPIAKSLIEGITGVE